MTSATKDLPQPAIPAEPQSPWPGVDALERYTTPERVARIDRVLRQRLASVTAVFEDVHDPHNLAACLRTCEGYGLQRLHLIDQHHPGRRRSTVAKSADQWLDLRHHASTAAAILELREAGFSIWVSDLQASAALPSLPLDAKVAIVVGNAKNGISEAMRAAADRRYILPMHGMVQSYNLSVALAVSLEQVVPRRRAELGGGGDLTLTEMWALRQRWLEFGQRHPDALRRASGDGTGPEIP